MVRALKAQTQVVIALCASLKDGEEVDEHTTREAISVAILMLIGQPLAQVISTVSERGLAQVPPALLALADEVDQSSPARVDRRRLGQVGAAGRRKLRRLPGGTAHATRRRHRRPVARHPTAG